MIQDEILDVDGCAKILKISKQMVYKLCADKKIPHTRLNTLLRFSKLALESFIQDGNTVKINDNP
jgi:excisionase family DNA binding protein